MTIKHFLTDIFMQIKQMTLHLFPNSDIPFAHNSSIIELIEGKYYLYEILAYFSEQFEMIIRTIGNNSSDSIFDDIIFYINHNFSKPLKLETLAPLFGYNSSYLGKLFSQKTGTSFNSYLDSVRITEAAKLLKDTNLKVYEISAQVGYKNVDYFHQKFKKIKNVSPAEFRKKLIIFIIFIKSSGQMTAAFCIVVLCLFYFVSLEADAIESLNASNCT